MTTEFKAWPKIPRGSNENICISEKMDGTNACIVIEDNKIVAVQSRKRFIKVGDDNFGFASWVESNTAELLKLGEGYHYGEWAGAGIQKNPHNIVGKKFFLFNTSRWSNPSRPDCCDVVPVLYAGKYSIDAITDTMIKLKDQANEDGYTPEGMVVWYCKTRRFEKYTFKFSKGKWSEE